jgi:predicted nucleic acid-binding protein
MDALHLALAHEYRASYFVTTDDKLLDKAKKLKNLNCRPLSPT